MKEAPKEGQKKAPLTNLQADIKKFADDLPIWGKILAEKILSGNEVEEADIENSYNALLEELKILPLSNRGKIDFAFSGTSGNYHPELRFETLRDVEGINALVEGQVLSLCGNLTILYGVNGSGKSGYGRLLKNVFYTKSREDILPNIHIDRGHKKPAAVFTFAAGDKKLELTYPADKTDPAFNQFSVFDGKGVLSHLDARNALEFRPAGLSFFSLYTDALKRVEAKLQAAVNSKQGLNPFPDIFEGESEIKTLINGLSANSKIESLRKFIPFTEKDKTDKIEAEKDFDDLLVASKGKDKEVSILQNIRQLLLNTKSSIEILNRFFTEEALKRIDDMTSDCLGKEKIAKLEGTEGFKTELFEEIGSAEWKDFIIAAHVFAQRQKEGEFYPEEGDLCILCHQELSPEAIEMIRRYWAFIKSEAEKKAGEATALIQQTKTKFEKLGFDLFPEGNILTVWMEEKKSSEHSTLVKALEKMKILCGTIIEDLTTKALQKKSVCQVNAGVIDTVIKSIDESLKALKDDEQQKALVKQLAIKTLFAHREKLGLRIADIEAFIGKQVWINKSSKASWGKRSVTDMEKELSAKYFNQKYIDTFNDECKALDGNFGIVVNHTGAAGASYRQLSLKGNSPSAILSEGEQKVIAIADFIAEMRMSEINRGMVFDDPVNSLDEQRKKRIAEHLSELSKIRQVIVFSHDLVFVSALITYCQKSKIPFESHWIEKRDDKAGMIFLNNSPSYEKEYRNNTVPMKFYVDGKKDTCPPAQREYFIRQGFTALRTCYEVLVISDLFKNVVQRFNERVSVDSLKSVYFDQPMVDELMDSFGLCCRYMEGHTHSDAYAYRKPELKDLKEEIDRYDLIRKKLKEIKKPVENK
jgi:hypothetical protein